MHWADTTTQLKTVAVPPGGRVGCGAAGHRTPYLPCRGPGCRESCGGGGRGRPAQEREPRRRASPRPEEHLRLTSAAGGAGGGSSAGNVGRSHLIRIARKIAKLKYIFDHISNLKILKLLYVLCKCFTYLKPQK